ncbi:TonB-dependent receptor [Sphingobacterium sp. DN00404]|uniref:TonB-dependent receptor n=2 Tax=Sphingobacterium micropteri TaxID=2763501 RepID=A0ABR7YQJ7_9SPHI|nr:TonB-dependent receptor [Sphingobacterium micropteri]
MSKRFFFSCCAMLFAAISFAQTVVTGVVSDNVKPLGGVTVTVRGTSTAASTDSNGNFRISVADPETAVLLFRFMGMHEQEVRVDGRLSGIEVQLVNLENQMEDVVVIGYGTQKRGSLTGTVASISGDVLAKVPTASVAEAMVGRLPGVQITAVDGAPDADITIRVRGGGSITQDNSPLILVDGFEVANLNDVPPSDIESVNVLKDASSTAIYGARGANGVILVTTKRPKAGRAVLTANSFWQMKTLSRKLDVMDPYEFVMMQYEYDRQRSSNPSGFFNKYGQAFEMYNYQGIRGVDWQKEIFGENPIARFTDINLSGGSEKTRYKFSLANQDQPGILVGNGLAQTNINLTLDTKLSDRLTLEYRTRFTNQQLDGAGTEGVNLLDALRTAPTEGLDDFMALPEDNTYFDPDDFIEVVRMNPQQKAANNYRKRVTRTFNTAAGLTWNVWEKLSFKTEISGEYKYLEDQRFWGVDENVARNNNNLPVIQWSMNKNPRWQWTNRLNYDFNWKDIHEFQFMIGQEVRHHANSGKSYSSRYFPENITGEKAFDNIALGTVYESSSSAGSPVRISSFFGRAYYGYDDRYLVTLAMRADGSTKFAPGNQWGLFPAVSAAWRVMNEEFMQEVDYLSNLKVRIGYGISGNDRIGSDLFAKYYRVNRNRPVGWGEEMDHYYYNFFDTNNLYNPTVRWETTISRNAGLDFGFFNEKINGTVDVYWNTVKDLLVPSDIPAHSGYTKIMTNVGQTSNRGIDVALNAYVVDKRDFSLNVNFNIGYNRTRIDNLATGENEWILSSNWAGSQLLNTDDYRAYVGGTKGLIFGFVNDGMYTMDDFSSFNTTTRTWVLKDGVANSRNLSGDPRPGNAKFKKLTPVDPNDPNTYVIGDNDRTVIGETTPDFSGGFGLDARYKNFDFTVFFNYMVGFDVFNANKVMMTSWYNNNRNNLSMDVGMDKRWRNFDDMGNEIRYSPDALAKFNENATMWNPTSIGRPIAMSYAVEDGSFLRLNMASLGYTLPQSLTKRVGINRARIYATGYNLLTITSYTGYDPEVNIETGLTPNIDYNSYPRSRTYTCGVQFTF